MKVRSSLLSCLVYAIVAVSGLLTVHAEPVRIERISFAERSDGRGYVIRVHAPQPVQAFSYKQPSASLVVLTLYNAAAASSFQKDAPEGPVTDYTLTDQGSRLEIRFELSSGQSIAADVYQDALSTDLLVGLSYTAPPLEQPATNIASEEPYVLSGEARERWKLDCVVIDPGHGGKDPGAMANGVVEKEIVLDVALKLGGYIEKYMDLRVVYTRKTDRFVPLHERGRIANKKCGKLFISIHANAAASHLAKGTETYILGLHKSEAARRVMERENSVIQLEEDPNRYSEFDVEQLVVQSLTQNMYLRESEQLAEKIQRQFKYRAVRNSRGVKQAGFLVLWRASMPAVLVELGFLTNPQEAAYLASERGQALLASAIFRAVRAYKAEYEKGLNFAVGEK